MISFQFWQKNRDFVNERYHPAFVSQYGRKYKFHLKSLSIGLLGSYETQNPKYYNKIDGNTSISKKFDNFVTFPILDFRESAEFKKNKD